MVICPCGVFVLAVPYVKLILLGQTPASGGPPSVTPRHLEQSSSVVTSTPAWPLTGNPVLDREKISGPQAVDVSTCTISPVSCHLVFTSARPQGILNAETNPNLNGNHREGVHLGTS